MSSLHACIHVHVWRQAAGLEVVAEVLSTQAILIANPNAEHQDIVDMIKLRVEGYITATKYSILLYNVPNDLVKKACAITPGKKSPTITTLDDGGKSISSLVLNSELSKKMDELHDLGATDILALDLSNSRM